LIVARPLPRFVYAKTLASGSTAFYWHVTKHYRKQGCLIPDEPLGTSYVAACGEDGSAGRALALNALLDEWRARKAGEPIEETLIAFGTIDWLFREYKQTKAYLEKVSKRSRRDYERTMQLITNLVTKKGALSGPVRSRHSEPVARRYQGQTR
jgi:hypothetical protein